jgi:hypothetical protein
MSKTVKKNESKEKNLDCCEFTYAALKKIYTNEFQKLGWMILAKDRKLNDKIEAYKSSLRLLNHSFELKIKTMKNMNKKDDLKIMKSNLEILIKHVNKDFK